jgi:hypothetical protein
MLFLRGLLLGLVTGALSAPSAEIGPWLPGLIFGALFLSWRMAWWRRLAALAVSEAVWWLCFQGASHAVRDPADALLFWARWGGEGAFLLGLGLLLLGCFSGARRFYALPLLALAGAALAQPFGSVTDRELLRGFMAWQGGIAGLLTALTQNVHHDL